MRMTPNARSCRPGHCRCGRPSQHGCRRRRNACLPSRDRNWACRRWRRYWFGVIAGGAGSGQHPQFGGRLSPWLNPAWWSIAETTRRLTGGLFDYKALGPARVEGRFDADLRVGCARRKSDDSRFEALSRRQFAACGTKRRVGLVVAPLGAGKAGEGRVVLLIGEAGIGKSRLVAALEQALGSRPLREFVFLCSPTTRIAPLYPVIRQMERAAQFRAG